MFRNICLLNFQCWLVHIKLPINLLWIVQIISHWTFYSDKNCRFKFNSILSLWGLFQMSPISKNVRPIQKGQVWKLYLFVTQQKVKLIRCDMLVVYFRQKTLIIEKSTRLIKLWFCEDLVRLSVKLIHLRNNLIVGWIEQMR